MNFTIKIVSLSGEIYSGEVEKVTLPSIEGQVTILARHMPIVIPLNVGEVLVKTPKEIMSFSIGKGIFEFSNQKARLLVEDVLMSDEISEERAIMARKKAEEILAKGVPKEEKLQVVYQLRRSLVDLKIARRKKKYTANIAD